MAVPLTASERTGLSRRTLLGGVAAVGAAVLGGGCTAGDPTPEPSPEPEKGRDSELTARAVADIERLRATYAATIAVHPRLAASLRPLVAQHEAHLAALVPFHRPAPAPSRSGSASDGASGGTSRSTSTVPGTRRSAVRALAGEESSAGDRRRGQVAAAGPALAQLLASIGACDSVHAALLET